MHRLSPATAISVAALVAAMSGTAYAATGGTFILGQHNTATRVSSLANSKGTALSLSSASNAAPLEVSNSVQIPNLNASLLGGQPASAFLAADGTAANSSELGGVPASNFVQGNGATITANDLTLTGTATQELLNVRGSGLYATCDWAGPSVPGSSIALAGVGQAVWSYQGGTGQASLSGELTHLTQPTPVPYVVVAQVNSAGLNIATYTVSETYNASTDTCTYTGQVVNTNS